MSDDMQGRLQAYYTRAFPDRQAVRISPLASMSNGWETDVYSFDVEYGPAGERQREELILRIYSGDFADVKSAHECHSLGQLHQVGYPVPRVFILERDPSLFGRPFAIMERITGQVMWPLLFGSSQDRQQEMLTLFCQLFVQLHTLDWRLFDVEPFDAADRYAFVDGWLSIAHDNLARFPESDFLPIVEWLQVRRDELPCSRPSPVHGDFHPKNILVRDDGSAVVIDWTGFGISDLRFDLAWALLLAYAYCGVEWRDRILREYERLAGARVEQIECFEVFACGRRLGDIYISLQAGAEKQGMRPEAVTMMKQQRKAHQRVYDLLVERTGIRVGVIEKLLSSLS